MAWVVQWVGVGFACCRSVACRGKLSPKQGKLIFQRFSDRGNEALRKICDKKLSAFFEQNVALWKRLVAITEPD